MRSVAKREKLWPAIVAMLMLLTSCSSGDNRVLEEVVEQVYSIDPNANISIHDRDGAILVYGSDVNDIRVRSLKESVQRKAIKSDRN